MTHNHTPRGSTMKCLRPADPARTGAIVRVRNAAAREMVATDKWKFTTKGTYRAQERNHVDANAKSPE